MDRWNGAVERTHQRVLDGQVMLILRLREAGGELDRFAEAATAAGVRALEVTIDTPDAVAWVAGTSWRGSDELSVGLGTVRTRRDLEQALTADPDFVVSPTVDPEVITGALDAGVLPIPGALTPTEISVAHDHGAPMVKLFPAASMGAGYVKAVRAPLPDVDLLVVGGIDARNAGEMVAAGASAVAVGSAVASDADARAGDYGAVERRLCAVVEQVRAVSMSSSST